MGRTFDSDTVVATFDRVAGDFDVGHSLATSDAANGDTVTADASVPREDESAARIHLMKTKGDELVSFGLIQRLLI